MPNGIPKGHPKSLKTCKNPQKSSPKCLPGRIFTQTLKKHRKLMISGWANMQSVHACAVQTHFSVFIFFLNMHQKYLQNAPFWAPFGPLGHQNTAFGPFRGQPKKQRFFGWFPMLTFAAKCHHFGSTTAQLLDPFLVPFSRRYPQISQCPQK